MDVIRVAPEVLAAMREHAGRAYPEECCGVLVGRAREDGVRDVVRIVPVENTRPDERRRRYLIGPDTVRDAEAEAARAGLDVVGFYHSHPDHPAEPSEFDRSHAWPWYDYLIVPVAADAAGEPRAWRLDDDRAAFRETHLEPGRDAAVPTGEPGTGDTEHAGRTGKRAERAEHDGSTTGTETPTGEHEARTKEADA